MAEQQHVYELKFVSDSADVRSDLAELREDAAKGVNVPLRTGSEAGENGGRRPPRDGRNTPATPDDGPPPRRSDPPRQNAPQQFNADFAQRFDRSLRATFNTFSVMLATLETIQQGTGGVDLNTLKQRVEVAKGRVAARLGGEPITRASVAREIVERVAEVVEPVRSRRTQMPDVRRAVEYARQSDDPALRRLATQYDDPRELGIANAERRRTATVEPTAVPRRRRRQPVVEAEALPEDVPPAPSARPARRRQRAAIEPDRADRPQRATEALPEDVPPAPRPVAAPPRRAEREPARRDPATGRFVARPQRARDAQGRFLPVERMLGPENRPPEWNPPSPPWDGDAWRRETAQRAAQFGMDPDTLRARESIGGRMTPELASRYIRPVDPRQSEWLRGPQRPQEPAELADPRGLPAFTGRRREFGPQPRPIPVAVDAGQARAELSKVEAQVTRVQNARPTVRVGADGAPTRRSAGPDLAGNPAALFDRRDIRRNAQFFDATIADLSPRQQLKRVRERLEQVGPGGQPPAPNDPLLPEFTRLKRREDALQAQRGFGRFLTQENLGRVAAVGAGAQIAETLFASSNVLFDTGRGADRFSIQGQLAARRSGEQVLRGIPLIGGALAEGRGFLDRLTGQATEQQIQDRLASAQAGDELTALRRSRGEAAERRATFDLGDTARRRLEIEQRRRAVVNTAGDQLSEVSIQLNEITPPGRQVLLSREQAQKRDDLLARRSELQRQAAEGNDQAAFEIRQLAIERGDRNFALDASSRGQSTYSVQRELLERRRPRGDQDAPLEMQALDRTERRSNNAIARRFDQGTDASALQRTGFTRQAAEARVNQQFDEQVREAAKNRTAPGGEGALDAIRKAREEAIKVAVGEVDRAAMQFYGRVDASRLTRRGFGAAAALLDVSTQFQATTRGMDRNSDAYRQAVAARNEGFSLVNEQQRRQNTLGRADYEAGALRLNRNPLAAQLRENQGQIDAEVGNRPWYSPDAMRARMFGEQRRRMILQQDADQTQSLGINLTGRERQQAAIRNRDPLGAQAAGIVASTREEELGLRRAGRGAEAERVRELGIGQLDQTRDDYLRGFRGEQRDLRLFDTSNAHDVEDPASVLRTIADAKNELGTAAKPAGDAVTVQLSDEAISSLVTGIGNYLTNLVKN
ncbi:MAG TPA: hypothetical protein VGN72_01115 [Tepidisphaeraceae bacterium]|jgi:hypothetical protein|nr:hypothetical protein [Tepidisphaeraceae bacterium]